MSIQDVVVRPFTASDLPKVRELHQALLPMNYPQSFFLQLLTLTNRICLIANSPSEPSSPIGFISATMASPNNSLSLLYSTAIDPLDLKKPRLEILTLGVLPAYQRCGLARLLMTSAIKYFRQASHPIGETLIHANVSTSNMSAIKFYECMGMIVSPLVIRNLYPTLPTGSRDAYLVVGMV